MNAGYCRARTMACVHCRNPRAHRVFAARLGAPRQALLSYLFAFLFFTGLSVGSLALAMVHALTGGRGVSAYGPTFGGRAHPASAGDDGATAPDRRACALSVGESGIARHDAVLRAQSWYLSHIFSSVARSSISRYGSRCWPHSNAGSRIPGSCRASLRPD